jgi:hypothetical protein
MPISTSNQLNRIVQVLRVFAGKKLVKYELLDGCFDVFHHANPSALSIAEFAKIQPTAEFL